MRGRDLRGALDWRGAGFEGAEKDEKQWEQGIEKEKLRSQAHGIEESEYKAAGWIGRGFVGAARTQIWAGSFIFIFFLSFFV